MLIIRIVFGKDLMHYFVAVCCAAFLPMLAHAEELKAGKDWRYCSKDDQCVEIEGLCGKTAVNWQVKDKAEAFYRQEREKTKCVENFWTPKEKVVRCHLGGCDMRPKQASDNAPATK